MYEIYELENGWRCCVLIQDGTERWTKSTLEKAIESVVRNAKAYNNDDINPSDIVVHWRYA